MISKPIAILIILSSFFGGFLLEGGVLTSLWHPSELIIILGLGLGTFLASTPVYIWLKTLNYTGRFFAGSRVSKKLYQEALSLLGELGRLARKEGVLAMQNHLTNPESSALLSKYTLVMKHKELRQFIINNFSYLITNPPASLSFKGFLEDQIEDVIQSNMEVPRAVGKIANLMPGFGIIAAVLGVILTMNLLGGDMDVAKIGTSIGSALVGTLTGIFFAFAVIAPLSHAIEIMIRQDRSLYEMTAAYMVAFQQGVSPLLSEDIARLRVPPEFEVPAS